MTTSIIPIKGEPFQEAEIQEIETQYLAQMKDLARITMQRKELEAQEKAAKTQIKKAFQEYGIKSIDNEFIKITYIPSSKSVSLDTKKFKEAEPKLFDELMQDYSKETTRSATIRFNVK